MFKNLKNNIHSQNGEDGIIEFVLSKLPNKDNWCCEFGAWDGKYLSNTYNLVENSNYTAVYIEGDNEKFNDLLNTKGKIIPIKQWVGVSGDELLDNILSKTEIPKNFDVLSIDVDGTDYCIWEKFVNYKPKIVIIEINSNFDPEILINNNVLEYEKMKLRSGSNIGGVNFKTCYELGKRKGYRLVTHTGNMIFIDEEYSNYFDNLLDDSNYLECFENLWFSTDKTEIPD